MEKNFASQKMMDEVLLSGTMRIVYMPVGHVEEKLAIAVIGQLSDTQPFARVVTSRPLKCLPNDLGHACLNFGTIVANDFLGFIKSGRSAEEWYLPLSGLTCGTPIEVEGRDLPSLTSAAVRLCALWGEIGQELVEEDNQTIAPRASDEARFLDAVQQEVLRRRPKLKVGFKRLFNLAGGHASNDIDFVGSRYATCYAAINPKSRHGARVVSASAALWRLARARDAFGFAAPSTMELTAWVPPEGLPIYSSAEYEMVKETVAELKAQASREELGVCAARDSTEAAKRLIETEGDQTLG
jgi:hypothetical protein